jgi:hypothetical protein
MPRHNSCSTCGVSQIQHWHTTAIATYPDIRFALAALVYIILLLTLAGSADSSMSNSDDIAGTCKVCGVETTKRCSQCKAVHYCGPAHQKEDWSAGHKSECNSAPSSTPIPETALAQAIRGAVSEGAGMLIEAIVDDILPDHDVCKLFGNPSERPEMERAVYACYQSAVRHFSVTREQLTDAHMKNTMDELILRHPEIRNGPYGRMVLADGGIKVERLPGVP